MGRYLKRKLIEGLSLNARLASEFTYALQRETRPAAIACREKFQFISIASSMSKLLADGTETSRRGFDWRVQSPGPCRVDRKLPHQFPILWGGLHDYSEWIGLS